MQRTKTSRQEKEIHEMLLDLLKAGVLEIVYSRTDEKTGMIYCTLGN